jgi:chromosomal replication initiation ATPase DnaA
MDINIPEISYIQAEKDFKTICQSQNWAIAEIISSQRDARLVERRRIIAKAMRAKGYSFPQIAHAMNRTHASIINLINPKNRLK